MKSKISLFAGFDALVAEIGLDKAAELLHDLGFSGVELSLSLNNIPPISMAKEYASVMRAHDLSIPCISCYAPLVNRDQPVSVNTDTVEALKRGVDFVHAVGSKYFHHTVYVDLTYPLPHPYQKVCDTAIVGALEVARYAASKEVTILYEPQGYYFNGKEGFLRFFNEMSRLADNVAICLDVGNPLWVDDDVIEIVRAAKDKIAHVHIKDYRFSESGDGRTVGGRQILEVPTADGEIPIAKAVELITESGYDGFFSIEDNTDISIADKFSRISDIINKHGSI